MADSTVLRKLALSAAMTALVFSAGTQAADFAPAQNLTVGNDPSALASGDLNGDNIPDLAVANYTDGTVSVMLGVAGNLGQFAANTDFPVGTDIPNAANRLPFGVAIGNVAGNSNPDIVVAVSGGNEVTILPGNGNGTFGSAINVPAGTDPRDVILANVDGANGPDIIAANFSAGTVTVLLNNGNDTFTGMTGSPFAAGNQPFSLVYADATGDGNPDIVLVNLADDTVSVLQGPAFTTRDTYTTGARPYGVAVADLDGIQNLDLVTANANGDSISVLLGDGAGAFATKVDTPLAVNSGPHGIAVADVGGDSNLDVVVTNTDDNTINVLEGNGSGSYAVVTNTFTVGTAPRPLVLDDFDGDGHPDIATTNTNAGSTTAQTLINDNQPTPTDDSFQVINGATNVPLDVLANDVDPDAGDTLTITAVGTPTGGGNASINGTSDGLIYTPGAADATETFTYTVADQFGYEQTANVSVTSAPNQPPSFTSSPVTAATQDVVYTYNITATAPEAGDTLSITATTKPAWLTLTDNGDGTATLSGTPTNAEVGDHAVDLLVTDSSASTGTQSFTVSVANVNDPPAPSAPAITTDEDTDGTSQIAPNDPDVGDTHTYVVTGQGTNGTAIVSASGLVTYTPNLNYSGSDSVTVTVTDQGGTGISVPVVIPVTVNPVNDPPAAVGSIGAQSATEGTAFGPLDVAGNFSDPDSTLSYSMTGLPVGTGLTINPATAVISGTPTDADAKASQPITVTVTADDGSATASQMFDLSVTDINNAPVFTSTAVTSATQDAAYTYNVTTSDADPGDALSITSGTLPGWLTLTDNGDGTATLSGTPTNADVGTANITLTVSDGTASTDQAFTITVANVNDAPTVTSGGIILFQDTTATVQVNVSDPDVGDTFTYVVTRQSNLGGNATVDSSGLVTYDATGASTGTTTGAQTVEVTVTDQGGTGTAVPVAIPVTVNATGETDSNGDGVTDAQATALGLDPTIASGDTDGDGIADANEIGDPNNPTDTDGDGVIDALEAGGTAVDASDASGLPLDNGDTVEITSTGQTLTNVSSAAAAGGPSGVSFPFGTVSYTTTSAVGGSVTVRMVFSSDLPANMAVYKVDGGGTYTELPTSVWTRVNSTTVDVTLTDGDPATDLDGAADGSIDDPIAIASVPVATGGGGGGGGGCTLQADNSGRKDPLMPVMMLGALAILYRRRKAQAQR